MKISAIARIHPRIEWPFIYEWSSFLSKQGISKIFLGEDRSKGKFVWVKKPNPKYYHLELDDNEIEERWQQSLNMSRQEIEIQTIPIYDNSQGMLIQQMNFFKLVRGICLEEKIDWILSHDVDEILILREFNNLNKYIETVSKFTAIHFKQLIFESRWDSSNDFKPKSFDEIVKYNPNVIDFTKYIYNIKKISDVENIKIHRIKEPNTMIEDPSIGLIHHLRGVENCVHKDLKKIQNFPEISDSPFDPIPYEKLILNAL